MMNDIIESNRKQEVNEGFKQLGKDGEAGNTMESISGKPVVPNSVNNAPLVKKINVHC